MVFTGFLSSTQAQVRLIKKLNDLCREVVVLKPETGLSDFHDATHQLEGLVWEESPQGAPGLIGWYGVEKHICLSGFVFVVRFII